MLAREYYFQVAELAIQIINRQEMKLTDSFKPFLQEQPDKKSDWQAELEMAEVLPQVFQTVWMRNQDFRAFLDEEGNQIRLYHDHSENDKPYAWTKIDSVQKRIMISYLPEGKDFFNESGNSFFHIGWEKVLIQENRLLLHASCVNTKVGGILFSGASRIGKSTQANLWCTCENASLINGDRPILYKKNGKWRAYGSPYAGSSGCHINASCEIQAIVFLEKASENSVELLGGAEAFRRLYSGLTINSWDSDYVARACNLAMEMVEDVPAFILKCVPEPSAVDILKKKLEENYDG